MLQGSLEDFALVEILGLLAETTKSGKLDISGDRGQGVLTFSSGKLAAARASNCGDEAGVEDVMFELLRYGEGSFVFSNQELELRGDEKNIAAVLSVAESRLAEWKAIEKVVPSLQHLASPVADLPADEVNINRGEWAALSIISAGCPVSIVCDELNLGEVEGCRRIKHLIERGLVEVSQPSSSGSPSLPPSSLMTEQKAPSSAPVGATAQHQAASETVTLRKVSVVQEVDATSEPAVPDAGAANRSDSAIHPNPAAEPTPALAPSALKRTQETKSPAVVAAERSGDSVVASLRGDSSAGTLQDDDTTQSSPALLSQLAKRPPNGANGVSGVATGGHKPSSEPGADEGLLMRYLKGQEK